jgi:DNA-binding winged helix-turn-helix (wHTH) protein
MVDQRRLVLGAAKLRAVLALLLLHANQLTSLDHLIDELWEEHPPSTAANLIQQYISRLRRMLRPGGDDCDSMVLLATRPGGYLLQVDCEALDANRFQALVEQSRLAIAGMTASAPQTGSDARWPSGGVRRSPTCRPRGWSRRKRDGWRSYGSPLWRIASGPSWRWASTPT